jgi:cysteine desulfurase
MLKGGFQQAGLRPGTESVGLAVGFEVAMQLWHQEREERQTRLTTLRDRLEGLLRAELPNIVVHGVGATRLPHTSNIAFPGIDRQAFLMALDLAGVGCSTGSACASGSSEPSPVLLAMGVDRPLVDGSLRFSCGAQTTLAEIDEAAERITRIYRDLRTKNRS